MSAFERAGRNALSVILGLVLPIRKMSAEAVAHTLDSLESPKILVIRMQQGLGDLLLATPVLRGLRERFPKSRLHFLVERYNALAVENNRRIEKLWVWDKRRMQLPFGLTCFVWTLRRERFDLVIVLSSNMPSFTSFLFAKAMGPRFLWAYDTRPFYGGAQWSRWLAHVEVRAPREDSPEFDKFLDLVRPLGIETDFAPEFEIPEEDRGAARVAWSKIVGRGPQIGLFLAGNPNRLDRLWPVISWRSLAERLERELGASVIAITPPPSLVSGSGASEKGFYEAVAGGLPFTLQRFSDSSLPRVTAFLELLTLFVTPDGGLFHFAVAARVPTVGLFMSTDPNKWAPPVPWASTLWARGVPESLTADQVLAHVRERLQTLPRSPLHS